MTAIEIKELTKQYKQRLAVDRLSLTIEHGDFFALLGLNGAGKTTTIKMLSGLTVPTAGDALVYGHSILSDMDQIKPDINVSPQETAIAPNLNVYDNLVFIARVYGCGKHEAEAKADQMLKQFGLDDRRHDKAKKLSGGLKRRLSVAMALITDPKILFLDEPTLGLDVRSRRELWFILKQLKGKTTVILTTHYLDEVEALADHIAIIDQGRLKALGTLEELKAQTKRDQLEDIFLALTEGGQVI